MSPAARKRRARAWWLVAIGFALSRLYYASIGLELDDSSISYFWQFLDQDALRYDAVRSIYYQHTQPPLFNAYLAVVLRTFNPPVFFRLGGLVCGLTLHLSLFALLRRFGVRDKIAVGFSWLLAIYPASALMELWVFYTYPVAALLVLAAALLAHSVRGAEVRSPRMLLAALTVMAITVLTRSLFHFAWLVAIVLGLLVCLRRPRRTLALAVLPLLLASSLYVKNYAVFGQATASSWLGFSLSRLVTTRLPIERVERMQREGRLSPLALSMPWWPLQYYPDEYRAIPPGTPDVPVLRDVITSTRVVNYNHVAFVYIGREFQRDAITSFFEDPQTWRIAARDAWELSLNPIHQYSFFARSRRRARPQMRYIERTFEWAMGNEAWLYWGWDVEPPEPRLGAGWNYAVLLLLAWLTALFVALARRRDRVALLYCTFTVALVYGVGNSVEIGENQRFRYLAEPLSWALIAFALERGVRAVSALWTTLRGRFRRRLRRGKAASPA